MVVPRLYRIQQQSDCYDIMSYLMSSTTVMKGFIFLILKRKKLKITRKLHSNTIFSPLNLDIGYDELCGICGARNSSSSNKK